MQKNLTTTTPESGLLFRFAAVGWLGWAVLLGVLTWPVCLWHLNYFKSPGAGFYRIALVAFPALAVVTWIYSALRGPAWLRYEPAIFAAPAVLACLAYEPKATVVVFALWLSCTALGRFALRRFGIPLAGPLEEIVAAFGAGAGILNVVLFIAGLAGFFSPSVFVLSIAVPLVLFWRDARQTLVNLHALPKRWQQVSALHPLTGVAVIFALAAMICTLMIALAPSVAFDSIAFHLPSVRYYAAQHALGVVPGLDYSYYPQGMELIWTLAYSLAGQAGAQIVSALFFLLFALLLMLLARRCGLDQGASAGAVVFAVTLPFLHWSGSVMKNDVALAFFEGLALLAFLRWMETRAFRWILAGTCFLAQAFGIKLVALFGAIPLAFFYAYAAWREPRRFRAAAAAILVFLVFGTWWTVRAYWLTGNPVAPATLSAVAGKYSASKKSSPRLVRDAEVPWRLIFHGENYFESPLPSPAGVVLLAFAPLALLGTRVSRKGKAPLACAIFTAVYLLYWVIVIRKVRYAILPFGLLCVWIAAQVWRFYNRQPRVVRASLIAVATYAFLIAIMGLMIAGINGPQLAYFSGRLDKPAYLRAAMIPYGAVEFVREHAPGARVLAVDNMARGYAADPARFTTMFCAGTPSCDGAKIAAAVRDCGGGYLILPHNATAMDALARLGRPTRVYADTHYSVYLLPSGLKLQ